MIKLPNNRLSRRKLLTCCVSIIGAIGAGLLSVPFIASWFPSRKAQAVGAPVAVDISKLLPGELQTVVWRQQPILVFRRTEQTIKQLMHSTLPLSDPESTISEQPDYAKNDTRSIKPEVGIYIANCTHLGCIPTYKPNASKDWAGGFNCPCHGSNFDLAGRVYESMPAPTNLRVPPHRFVSTDTVIVGEEQEV